MRSLIFTLALSLTLFGCGSASASSTEPATGNPVPATPSSGNETVSETPVAHDSFRHECEMRRAAASCGGCAASYGTEEETALQMGGACTRTENGAQVACASECCMTCPQG